MRAHETQEKLYHHFETNVSAVWQMSHQDRAWPDSNCICDYWNTKIAQNASFKNYRKNSIINSKPMYPLYDRCQIKTEVDMNPSFIVMTAKMRSRCELKNHKKKLYHHFEANVSTVWQMSRQDRAWPDSNCICDYWNTKIAQNTSFKNHKKNFIIDSKPMYPLYDKCHVKTEHDLTPIAFVKHKICSEHKF